MSKIRTKGEDIIKDNNFLFVAFENRLLTRLVNIFDKYKIPMSRNIIKKNLEENFINNLNDSNREIIERYTSLLGNYETIIQKYVENKTDSSIIKRSTLGFIEKIAEKNKEFVTIKSASNFIEYINSIIFVYDNHELNEEVLNRINNDTKEILNEFNRNNYNFVIESINDIIKNIIRNM